MPHMLPSISMTIPALREERATSPLPPISQDVSRPPSASTSSDRRNSHHGSEHSGEKVTLPALSTLANVASSGEPSSQSQSAATTQTQNYSNPSPTPTSVAGQGNVPPVCQNCQTSTTPLWRRDEAGSVLCNACGLFLKLHGRPRPISLKTDVIKSRNRVKSSAHHGRRKMQFSQGSGPHHSVQHPDYATPPPHPSYRRVSDQQMSAYSDRSASPVSRTGTPASLHPHHTYPGHPHTAPPISHHFFDGHHARSPSPLPVQPPYHSAPSTIAHRGTSPLPIGSTLPVPVPSINRAASPSLPPTNPGGASVSQLQTRISELEVINSLYKSKVQELEGMRERDIAMIHHLQRELDGLRSREFRADRQPVSEGPHDYARPPRPEAATEHTNYAEVTGSMKRRRGRTLEKAAEESRMYGSKRRETGEFPQPGPTPVQA